MHRPERRIAFDPPWFATVCDRIPAARRKRHRSEQIETKHDQNVMLPL
jgi:hypothetical protein